MRRLLVIAAVLTGLVLGSGLAFTADAENVGPMVYTWQNPRSGTIYQPSDLPGFCTGAPCPWYGNPGYTPNVQIVPGPQNQPWYPNPACPNCGYQGLPNQHSWPPPPMGNYFPQQGGGYPPQYGQGYPPQYGQGYPPQYGQGYPPQSGGSMGMRFRFRW